MDITLARIDHAICPEKAQNSAASAAYMTRWKSFAC